MTIDVAPYRELLAELDALRAEIVASHGHGAALLTEVREELHASATNLLHYLALRRRDRRALQEKLAARGFSSLGRSESHVLAALDAVRGLLSTLLAEDAQPVQGVSLEQGRSSLRTHADVLLGPSPPERRVRVMVTLPSEAAHDREQVRALLRAGMDCARINAAHDDVKSWRAMARNVREASRELGRRCLISVDLPGPKVRTGAIELGPEVVKLKPRRDPLGDVVEPARAWLVSEAGQHTPALPVREAFLDRLRVGSTIKLRDARGKRRRWHVEEVRENAARISCEQTSYVRHGTLLRCAGDESAVGQLARVEQPLLLHPGDLLALTRDGKPGRHARAGKPATIPCEPPALLEMVRAGEAIWFDDGRIAGVIEDVDRERALVRVTQARTRGEKLRAGKGINLPDTDIRLPALSSEDHQALAFAVQSADLVSLSFLRAPEDVFALQQRLYELGRPELGVVLKIETRAAFERLPELILAGMRRSCPGVMIARGDLAVECGFERLAELQEEILWLCEAAHVPVVWATQVLESLAKTGRPTRAEVTDAAMAERAECVMLNKGPYVAQAVGALDDILRRMSGHQHKKTSMFRALQVAERFAAELLQGAE